MLGILFGAVVGAAAVTMHGGNYKFPGSRIVPWALIVLATFFTLTPTNVALALLVFGGFRLGEMGPFLTMGAIPRVRDPVTWWGRLFDKLPNDALSFTAIKAVQLLPAAALAGCAYGYAAALAVLVFAVMVAAIYWCTMRISRDLGNTNLGVAYAEALTGLLYGIGFVGKWA